MSRLDIQPKGDLVDYSVEGARFFRGGATRAATVAGYAVEPLRRFRVPNGAVIGACGHETTTPYEIRISKKNGEEVGVFLTGSYSAEKLIDLAGLRRPVFIDPLKPSAALTKSGVGGGGGGGGGQGGGAPSMTRLNREVYEAINLILIAWGRERAEGLFLDLLSQINRWGDRDLFAWRIEKMNTAIRNRGFTMKKILWLASKKYEHDGELRDIDFQLIRSALAGHGVEPQENMF